MIVRYVEIIDDVFQDVKKYVLEKSKYAPKILKTTPQEISTFPLIVVEETDDSLNDETLKYTQQKFDKTIEISIYTIDKTVNGKTIAKEIISNELKILVNDILDNKYHLNRRSCKPTPNMDRNVYKLSIRYLCLVDENKHIYRK